MSAATTPTILYLHGFASSPHGFKIQALRRRLEPAGVRFVVPDLNVPSFEKLDFDAMTEAALDSIRDRPPLAVVGSSLGALVALSVAARSPVAGPLMLIAPAVGCSDLWTSRIPDGDPIHLHHHGEGRVRPIHRRFFEQLAGLTIDQAPPPTRVLLLIGTEDESVPLPRVQGVWERWRALGTGPGSQMIVLPGGDHRLEDALDVVEDGILGLRDGRAED